MGNRLLTATIVIANQKGGVGKTATAVNLAHGLAIRWISTLLIDTDPQGNITDSLGLEEGNDLINLLLAGATNETPARANLAVIRSDKNTAGLKANLAGRDYREYILQEAIDHYINRYQLVIIDTAPSIDTLHIAALMAADYLLIPTKLDQFSVKGVLDLLTTVGNVKRRGGKCVLGGIIPTMYDRTTSETQKQLENLVSGFGPQVWPMVPMDTNVRTANRAGKTLWEYAPATRALVGIPGMGGGYLAVLNRLIETII